METILLIIALVLLLSAPYCTFMIAKAKYENKVSNQANDVPIIEEIEPEKVKDHEGDEFITNFY
jgi:multisubunit Na+/H+ antiporter MnhG subunit